MHRFAPLHVTLRNGQQVAIAALNFALSPKDIAETTEWVIAQSDATLDAIAAVPIHHGSIGPTSNLRTSVVLPLANMDTSYGPHIASVSFLKDVAGTKDVRDASRAAVQELEEFNIRAQMRTDVFERVSHVATTPGAVAGLSPEEARFIAHAHRAGKRAGLHQSDAVRARLQDLKTRIGKRCLEFEAAVADDATTVHVSRDDLRGMPASFVDSLKTADDGSCIITLAYPHVHPILKQCTVESTRRRVEYAFNRRGGPDNVTRLCEVLALRTEVAKLLGYPSHAAFCLDILMAKTPEAVQAFLDDLEDRVRPAVQTQLAELKALKQKERQQQWQPQPLAAKDDAHIAPATTIPDGAEEEVDFGTWDLRYYETLGTMHQHGIDHDAIKQYFPLDVVTANMFAVYEQLLGISIERVPVVPHRLQWHPDVQLFAVRDGASSPDDAAHKDGALLGFFFMDLHPREGKFPHAALFPLVAGCAGADGGPRMLPVSAMVCNFPIGTPEHPSLLSHTEVETYFHEFGHALHYTCSHTELATHHGLNVETDFVEAPSQMLENWCWDPEALIALSGHVSNPSMRLPAELATQLASTRTSYGALETARQLVFSAFDMACHTCTDDATAATMDVCALYSALHTRILGYPATTGTTFPGTFTHITGGYDAKYYAYLWSEVFAADMFATQFQARGLLNPSVGAEYRAAVLAPGASDDAFQLLRSFLGRDPTAEAFLRVKGLTHGSSKPDT